MLTVHVRVNDAATGQPTPVRIRFFDVASTAYVPFGRVSPFATGPGTDVGGSVQIASESWHYIDGTCEVALPQGVVTVEVRKGPEYSPLRQTMELGPGQISMRLAVSRWINLRAERWFSGDTRVLELSPHGALLEAAAEDVAVVNLLAYERPPAPDRPAASPNLLAFSGSRAALENPGHIVAVNTLNAHPILGTVALLNSHRPVFPLRFGAPDQFDHWSVADWCDQCHRKKGLVVWPDAGRSSSDRPQGEALAALLLGKIDALEINRFPEPEPANLGDYYRFLDCGLRLPLVGGSGKDSNGMALGAVRTYARLLEGEGLSYRAWVEAVRAGRTFVTNGPLLTFQADEKEPGETVAVEKGKTVRYRAEARGTTPFDCVEVLFNGTVLAAKPASGNRQATLLEGAFTPAGPGWLAARCWGLEYVPGGQCVYAHSSPIYLSVPGQALSPDAATVEYLSTILNRTRQWVVRDARCETEQQRDHLLEVLDAGLTELQRRSRLASPEQPR